MAEYDLPELALEAGIRIQKALKAIEVTQSLEDELYAIIYQILNSYRQQFGFIEGSWREGEMSKQIVEGIIAGSFTASAVQTIAANTAVENWAGRVEKWHRSRWVGSVRGGTRLDVSKIIAAADIKDLIEAATARNVALIKGLNADIEKRISVIVWNAYQDGLTGKQLAKTLRADFGFAPKRARLIARDQLAKYSGALDEFRHKEAGLNEYEWKTVGDENVRSSHRANNGKQFSYDKPPAITGHPGHDIQCRCKARPLLFSEKHLQRINALKEAA